MLSRSTTLKSLLVLVFSGFLVTLLARAHEMNHETHEYIPAQPGDSRSPCPALNTLANHGYLPRDGRSISPSQMSKALKEAYHLSSPLSTLLTYGGFFLLRAPPPPTSVPTPLTLTSALSFSTHLLKTLPSMGAVLRDLDLSDLALHNHIEHDASLVHDNTPLGKKFASTHINSTLLETFLGASATGTHISLNDIALARVYRESQTTTPPIDAFHAEVARGEVALVLGIFGAPSSDGAFGTASSEGVKIDWIKEWFGSERLPIGWAPTHLQTLRQTVASSSGLRAAMGDIAQAIAGAGSKEAKVEKPVLVVQDN
ncbi:hypothetical protein JAAARDRAFT_184569 [Jaapia argillacea MUCL 33604]|uniref:Heme haloperoxidase family profile domain-containing protein n=1 Tax=Jaapia argillacea MUCL 33604 TaxID=933084 RepID=A0A067PDS0_9AGAM|nr:hypothetical protein JAAARDRAFT_184569 [Jaapia argillacea MUCL 33604]